MFLPYADDPPPERRFPWMNWLLIALNTAIFAAYGMSPDYQDIVARYGFTPAEFNLPTMFTAMFLHGSWMHLLGNMWFLYLFGDNVENRVGPFKYLLAYLICGLAGDYSHYMFFSDSTMPSIGASGAIFGVMGMYLMLFPRNRIRVLYFLFILIGRISVSAIWVIGMFAGMELLYSRMLTQGGLGEMESSIGHLAHAGGFVAGTVLSILYAGFGLIPVYGNELFGALVGTPDDLPNGARPGNTRPDEPIDARYRVLDADVGGTSSTPEWIAELLRSGRTNEARHAWLQLAAEDRNAVLPVAEQLEIALLLDRGGDREAARDAYERITRLYANRQTYAAEASLALAGMLLRELQETGDRHDAPRIHDLLENVVRSHPQPARRALAARWMAALGPA